MATLFDENRFEAEIDSKVKTTVKNELPKTQSYRAEVLRKDSEGTWWVRVDGNDSETPVLVNKVDMSVGDIVTVTIADHVSIADGNITSPPMSASNTQKYVGDVVADNLKAVTADIGYLKADVATIGYAQIEDADITNARIQNLVYQVTQNVTQLQADRADIVDLKANALTAGSAVIVDLKAETAKVENLTAEELEAASAYVEALEAEEITAASIIADRGDIADLKANTLTAAQIAAQYAKIDAANIDSATIRNAWVDQIMVQTGLLAHEGTIFELDAIQVNASSIKAGTLDVERLVVTQTDQQGNVQKYLVHVDGSGNPTYQKLDGNIVEDLTITADKIVAGAITAEKITTENLVGTGGWINLRNGTFAYGSAVTGEGIAWDGQHLTISGDVTIGPSMTLLELLQQVEDTIVFKVTEEYSADEATATLTAHVYRGGEDVASSYPGSCFAWYRKNEDGSPRVPLGNGRTMTVQRSSVGYGAAIQCTFTPPNDSALLTESDDTLTDSEGTPLAARTPSGDYVRVADLEATTTVFDTDRLMLVGSEEEQLVSIATLKDVFGDGDYERLSNKPSIEGVTLSGNKDFPDLGIFQTDSQGYSVPDEYTLTTLDINALWANAQPIGA